MAPATLFLLKSMLLPAFLSATLLVLRALYRLSPFHSLAHIPGPYLPRISSLWLVFHAWIGDECTVTHKLHQKHGPIVRTGPNSVDIADGEALSDIYSKNGGFPKTAFYGNFDIDGHKSIFSEIVPERRAPRAKAVLPLFAAGSLRTRKDVLEEIVARFVKKFERMAEWSRRTGKAVNLLDLTRGLAVDAVTGYLFGRAYGGLDDGEKRAVAAEMNEQDTQGMSANCMVDLFVGVGRFWYLPSWAFKWADWFDVNFGPGSSKDVGASLDLVDAYVATVVKDAKKALEAEENGEKNSVNGVRATSYPARLLSAGLSVSETRAQCKDLIFAGTDSTGMNLATIVFYPAKQPESLKRLEQELKENKDVSDIEIQSFTWLRGVVREGLRLSMATQGK